MAWLNGWGFLLLAGICEVFYASIIPRTDGFTRLWPSLYCGFFLALSIYLLSCQCASYRWAWLMRYGSASARSVPWPTVRCFSARA